MVDSEKDKSFLSKCQCTYDHWSGYDTSGSGTNELEVDQLRGLRGQGHKKIRKKEKKDHIKCCNSINGGHTPEKTKANAVVIMADV